MMKPVILIDIDENKIELELEKTDQYSDSDIAIWSGLPEGYDEEMAKVVIFQNSDDEVFDVQIGTKIKTDELEIREQFLESLIEYKKHEIESEYSGIENTNESPLIKDKDKNEIDPYDPELIRVDPKQISVQYIHQMINSYEQELDLSPDFQRNFVWNDITRKSRLIESLLLRIPLPVFYFTQDREGKYQVVDGVQRLTVINSYMNNDFKLKNLEYLKECEGKYFNKEDVSKEFLLDPKYVRRINGTQLSCNIIDPQTPPKVKFDIFRRINTAGKTLNPQEIRNCLANSRARTFLKKLAGSKEFLKGTDGSINSTRMADQDLVLRFIGFYFLNVLKRENLNYKGDMETFLDDVLTILNDGDHVLLNKVERAFYNSMKNANFLFGKYAFRKCFPEHLVPNSRKQLLNKSLFVTISVLLSTYNNLKIVNLNAKNALLMPFANEMKNNLKYQDVLTNGTTDQRRLNQSFEIASKIIKRELKYVND